MKDGSASQPTSQSVGRSVGQWTQPANRPMDPNTQLVLGKADFNDVALLEDIAWWMCDRVMHVQWSLEHPIGQRWARSARSGHPNGQVASQTDQ